MGPKPPLRIPRKTPSFTSPKISAPPPPRIQVPHAQASRAAPKTQPQPPPPQASAPPRSQSNLSASLQTPSSYSRLLFTWSSTALVTFSGFIFLRDNFASLDTIKGSSMAPTLNATTHETGHCDWVLVKRGFRNTQNVQRGDIVTFWKPHKSEEVGIKRVVAVGGDTVWPKRGYAVEGQVVDGGRLGLMDGLPEGEVGASRVLVPYGHVWVEGDNWRKSLDSNDFGPISMGLVEGKAGWVWRRGWWRVIGDARAERDKRGSRVVEAREKAKLTEELREG